MALSTQREPSHPSANVDPANLPGVVRALRDDGSVDPACDPGLTSELLVALYEHMVLARVLDQRLTSLQREGRIAWFSSALGEEAAIFGAVAAMRESDWLFPSSRELGAVLWRGISLRACMHHAFATGRDPQKGRSSAELPGTRAAHVVPSGAVVGSHIPHAVGFAWAARMRGDELATIAMFGEGATSAGEFHTGLNFAGVFRAPAVFVCRNNGWAVSTPASTQTASSSFAIKALAYGISGVRVDGGDALAMAWATQRAIARAMAGEGATLVEAVTRRLESADIGTRIDPLVRARRHLEVRGLWSEEREERHRAEVEVDIASAIDEASRESRPPPATMFDDVYAERPWHLREQAQ
jgi:2-oxoisovalerate dehydrogenase E1 component alpha subunit